jgi:hypothetical protein
MEQQKRILSFEQFKSISESYNPVDIEQILTPEKKDQIIAQINKLGITPNNPGEFKFIDDEGIEHTLMLSPEGEIVIMESMDEGIKDIIKTGIVCTMLASGLVSCTKSGGGFGYNVSVKGITHDLQKGDRTKEVTVVTPSGERTEMVNPGDTARFTWGGHAIYVRQKPTSEELQTAAFGAAIRREQSSNNGRGYDSNRYIVDATKSEIKLNPGYTDGSAGAPAESIYDHEDYKIGRNAINEYPERWEEFKVMNPIQDYEL